VRSEQEGNMPSRTVYEITDAGREEMTATRDRVLRDTRYRPDPWRWPEWLVTASGLTSAVVLNLNLGYDPAALNPGFHPLHWPTLPVLPAIAILAAALAAVAAPPPELPAPQSEPPAPATPSSPEPAFAVQPTGVSS